MTSEKPGFTPMRSVLTVPVIVQRFIDKAPSSGADVICLDLEDSVPPAEKANARPLAAKAIQTMPHGGSALYARLNALSTGLLEDDLLGVIVPGLDGIILSKTDSAATVQRVDHYIALLERDRGIEPGSVAIAPLIETAAGIMNSAGICAASPRVVAAVFGAEDFATDMGVQRTREGEEIRWARAQMAIACHAADIVAIDTPEPDYTDEPYLEREMQVARGLGYQGKLCIHPTQVAIANKVFRPSDDEVAEARVIVEAFERDGLAQGRAAIPLGGRMVDTPIYWRAKRLLEWADTVGGR
jgi:citrate lyase subunit beta/citryl-CoA lyase